MIFSRVNFINFADVCMVYIHKRLLPTQQKCQCLDRYCVFHLCRIINRILCMMYMSLINGKSYRYWNLCRHWLFTDVHYTVTCWTLYSVNTFWKCLLSLLTLTIFVHTPYILPMYSVHYPMWIGDCQRTLDTWRFCL